MQSPENPHKSLKIPIGALLAEIFRLVVACRGSLLLLGDTGIGKSEFIKAEARGMGLELVVLNLSLMESPGELLGLPRIQGEVTTYARPSWLPTQGRGVLVLEELTRVAPYLLAPLYEFLTARRLGDYVLPEGWVIVACANPPGPDFDVGSLDKAMRKRFLCVDACVDREEWIRWAETRGVHPAVLAIAREDAKLFDLEPPRTWVYASGYLHAAEQTDASASCLKGVLAALLSSVEAAHLVMKYLGDAKKKRPIGPADVVSRYAFDEDLAQRVRQALELGHTDVVEKLAYGVEDIVSKEQLATLSETGDFHLASFERFLLDIPGDRREALQHAFATNPVTGELLDVDPSQALIGFNRSDLLRRIRAWQQAPNLHHRVGAVAHMIVAHLNQLAALERMYRIRNSKMVRKNILSFIEHLGPQHGRPVVRALTRHGFEGIAVAVAIAAAKAKTKEKK